MQDREKGHRQDAEEPNREDRRDTARQEDEVHSWPVCGQKCESLMGVAEPLNLSHGRKHASYINDSGNAHLTVE